MELLDQGVTLITPTKRLSRYLQHQYAFRQLIAGRKAWPTPDVLPWSSWLLKTWEEFALDQGLDQVLLGTHQQLLLWREIISRSAQGKRLLQPATAARQALLAWTLCQQWQLPIYAEDVYLNEDAFAFRHWADAYQQRCEKNGWIDEASLAGKLAVLYTQTGKKKMPVQMALAGFDELTPCQRSVINALKATGNSVVETQILPCNEKTIQFGLHDSRAEIDAAARWARNLLESDPDRSIGIVVQNLRTLHARIQNIFDDVFFPGAVLAGADEPQRPYSIALGRPLSHYPVIDTALLILGLGGEAVPLEDFGMLLRTPFIGKAVMEGQQRAKLDAYLRRNGEFRITFGTVQQMLKDDSLPARDVPGCFVEFWRKYRETFHAHDKKQTAGNWARVFSDLLQAFRWPGDRPLDSAEYQTVAEWQEQLRRFAALDQVSPLLFARDALSLLRQMLMNSSFQPETPEVPIQILGMTGAAAMQFDHLWIMGLHEEVWPGKAEPNPFIPVKLQRELGMPGASPEIKLLRAQNLLECLVRSSPDVVLSYPQNENDRELRASPLLKPYAVSMKPCTSNNTNHYAGLIYQSRRIEEMDDTLAPAVPAGQVVSGGTGLFRDQAACPFRAFARHRLYAEGLDSKDIGLDPRARGSLMHEVMEKLWRRLGSSQALLDLREEQLEKIIHDSVHAAVRGFRRQFPQTFTERFTQLETDRLRAMVYQFLEQERARKPFTVQACEHWHRFTFNDITISTRIDRIDQLADGRYVIMDYKTGDPKISHWFSERPDEPQLPLYAITSAGELAAIVFTPLKKDGVGYIGLARENELLPGVKTVTDTRINGDIPDWGTLFTKWRETLGRLAINFRQGVAVVDPKSTKSCTQCDLHNLCRIHERVARYVIRDTENE